MQRQLIRKKISIVGCGPVGMFGTLLFQHFGIDCISVQRNPSVRVHPNTYWISSSSKSLFAQIPGLAEQLNKYQQQQKWEYYSCYRYVESIFGKEFAVSNHFQPNVGQKLKDCQLLFGQKPSHIPQNKLVKIMHCYLKNKDRIIFGEQIVEIRSIFSQQSKKNQYLLVNSKGQKVIQAQYVILCSGSSSKLRQSIPSQIIPFVMQGQNNLMNFINIHFMSDKLAQKINQLKVNAMLHFVYNKKIIGILINHSVSQHGQFILQLVNYEPFVDILQVYEPKQIVAMIFDQTECPFAWKILNDVSIVSAEKWEMSATLADRFYSNGIFLAGDCAHSIPATGGFGMNIGFHDINQLVHSFLILEKNSSADKYKIFQKYSKNRWEIDLKYLKKAVQNYEVTKQIAKKLGFSSSPVQIFQGNSILKSVMSTISQKKPHYMQKIRLKALNMMFKPKQIGQPGLELFFDQFDISCQKLSIVKHKIMKRNSKYNCKEQERETKFYTLYAKQWSITMEEIKELYGQINAQNIKFFSPEQPGFQYGQRLIASDGSILLL